MKLRFTKMHGLGNDFVMIDAISQPVKITPDRARKIADRNFGVGCDHIDLDGARRLRIPVGNTPGVLDATTADMINSRIAPVFL